MKIAHYVIVAALVCQNYLECKSLCNSPDENIDETTKLEACIDSLDYEMAAIEYKLAITKEG